MKEIKERICFIVRETGQEGILFYGKDKEECIAYIINELRNRNKNDGYDEYWFTAHVEIVKQVITEEIVQYC